MKDLKQWFGLVRGDFLCLDVAYVVLATATAIWTHGGINIWYLILAFIGTLCAHVAANSLNEYGDFRSGLDLMSEPAPSAAATGRCANTQRWLPVPAYRLARLTVTALTGLSFLIVRGWSIPSLGLLGLLVIVVYTHWNARLPLASLSVTGWGSGLPKVQGTNSVLAGEFTWTVFWASLAPFLVRDWIYF